MLMIKQFLITRMHLKQKELRIRILCKSETQRPVHVQRLTQNLLTIHRLRMMEMMTIHQAAEQAAAYEALGDWEYLGEFTITAYCPCEDCCGRWADGVTASGLPAGPGIVAVDRSVIPLGSTVVINGQRYLAADTGVTGNRVDICMTSHEDTVAHGVRTAEVWVVS